MRPHLVAAAREPADVPLDPDAVGYETDPTPASWTPTDALLYAVGVGAGVEELAFTTENSSGVDQQVLPTFPVVIGRGAASVTDRIGSFDKSKMVHGRQAVTLHQPLPVEGVAELTGKVAAMYDKGSAAVMVSETAAMLDGKPLYTTTSAVFIRGEGGWGGARGPSGPQNVPPDRAPDERVTYTTSSSQALVYRLSGDRNPLHSDPSFAARGGFDRPILHGLCTFGFTGRALLQALCGGDPARFHHVEARFASPVYPGESLAIAMWQVDDQEAVFTTSVGDRVVIDQGLLRYS
jgi:acyl dehydratase